MRNPPDALMLFAAGRGTRMAPLTDTTPKPLIPVGGVTLLDRALAMARDGGARRIVVNTHHLGDRIAAHLAGSEVAISDEGEVLLDTGGGLRRALPLLGAQAGSGNKGAGAGADGTAVLTLNPDVVWTGPNPVAALRAAWDGARMDALLMLVPVDRAQGRVGGGDFSCAPDGRITRGGPLVYTGAQIVRPDRLAEIAAEVFSLNALWDLLIADGRVFGMVHPGGWCDVGRPDCIALAERMLDG